MDNITKIVIAAKKAGLSYGHYVAKYGSESAEKAAKDDKRRCAFCGKELLVNHGNRKYCDDACKMNMYYKIKHQEVNHE